MDKVIEAFSNAIERLYNSFVFRDLLGYVLPGSLLLSLLWLHFANPKQATTYAGLRNSLAILEKAFATHSSTINILAFIALSYLAGWILQCIHFGLIDWLYRLVWPFTTTGSRWRFLLIFIWPVAGAVVFMRSTLALTRTPEKWRDDHPLSIITAAALGPDIAKHHRAISGERSLPNDTGRYTERLSAVMLMTGNVFCVGVVAFVLAAFSHLLLWWGYLICGAALLLIYVEFWRMWFARNLREVIAFATPAHQIAPAVPTPLQVEQKLGTGSDSTRRQRGWRHRKRN